MKSVTSFYNGAFIRSNLRRYGIFGLIFFIITATISNFGILANMITPYEHLHGGNPNIFYPTPWEIAMVLIVPVVFGLVLFRFLMEEKALSAIHAMPVSRKSLFGSQYITFILLYGLPVLLNGLIALMIVVGKGYPLGQVFWPILSGILWLLLTGTAVFAFTVMIGMLLGSTVLQVALVYIMMGASFIIVELTKVLIGWSLLGYPGAVGEIGLHTYLTPYYAIIMALNSQSGEGPERMISMVVVVVMLVASIALSWYFYKKRHLEKHHDLIAFKGAKHFFSVILTLMATLSLAGFIGALMEEHTAGAYVGLTVGALIGYAIMKMITEKTVRILRHWKQMFLVAGAALLTLVVVDMDFIGYEQRLPETGQVAYVYYSENVWPEDFSYNAMKASIKDKYSNAVILHDGVSIDAVKELHSARIGAQAADYTGYQETYLVYVLKDGTLIKRSYSGPTDKELVAAIHELPEYKAFYLEQMAAILFEAPVKMVEIQLVGQEAVEITPEEVGSFFEAYSADYHQMTYFEQQGYYGMGNLVVTVIEEAGTDNGSKTENLRYRYYNISPSFEATKAWLVQNGYGNLLPKLEEVVSVSIRRDQNSYIPIEKTSTQDVEVTEVSWESRLVESKEDIERLWNLGYDFTSYEEGYIIDFNLSNDRAYQVRVVDLPEEFRP